MTTRGSATPDAIDSKFHDIGSIVASGVLRVGISRFDIPPIHRRRTTGLVEGREAELAYQIARALSVKVVFVDDADTFDNVVGLVASGRVDIALSALTQNFAAAKSVRFSAPCITLRHALRYDRRRRPMAAPRMMCCARFAGASASSPQARS